VVLAGNCWPQHKHFHFVRLIPGLIMIPKKNGYFWRSDFGGFPEGLLFLSDIKEEI